MTFYNNYLDLQLTIAGAWLQRQRAKAEWQLISRHLSNVNNVLEIGPGHGVFSTVVRDHHSSYVAIESNRLIAETVARYNSQVCLSLAPPLPFVSSCFDVAYASHVIEHMPSPLLALEFIQEAYRVLRPGGLLVLSAPDMLGFGNTFWDADYTHTFPVTSRRLRQLMSDTQLEVVAITWFSGPVSGFSHWPLSLGARLFPLGLFGWNQGLFTRLERFRLSFLRNICMIARKP